MPRIHIAYDRDRDALVGAAMLDTMVGRMPVYAVVSLRPIGRQAARALMRREAERAGVDGRDQVGFLGFAKKAWSKVWKRAKTIARAVGVTKVVRALKKGARKTLNLAGKIARSPAFGALMGAASFIPGVGPIALAGYAGVRAAMALADGARRGDPKALETVGRYALPGGEKTMALIRSVAPGVA